MGQFVNERRIRMIVLWTIFVGVLGLFVPELNASTSSNSHFITPSSFVSPASSSISTIALSSSIQNTTSTTNGGILATGISLTADASNSTTAAQLPSSTVLLFSPSASSSLKTKTSILSVLATRTLNQSSTVPLDATASQTSINVVISTSSSVHFSNSSAETSSALSVLFSRNDSSSTVSETRTSNAWPSSLQTSVGEGSQSTLTSLQLSSGSVSVNTTSLNSLSLAVSPSGSVSVTRTLFMNQSFTSVADATANPSLLPHSTSVNVTTNYGSSTGLPSESVSATLVLQLDTSSTVLSSSVAMVLNRTLSSSYSTSIFKSSSTSASKSVNDSFSTTTTGVSISVSASSTAKSNDTVLRTETISEALVTLNSTATTAVTSKSGVSSMVSHSSETALVSALQSTSSVTNSTLGPSVILSSIGRGGNRTSSVSSTHSALFLSSELLSQSQINQTVASVTTSAELPSNNVTVALHITPFATGSSSVDKGVGSSITNYTSAISSTLILSVTVSSSLAAPQNATSQSLRSIPLNTSSKVTPLSTVVIGVVSSTVVTSGTSRPLVVSPSLVMSHNASSQFVETSSLSSRSVAQNNSVIAASLSSVSDAGVASLTIAVTPELSSSKLSALPSLMVSPNVTIRSSMSGGLSLSSKTTPSSRQISQSSSLSSNKTSTNDEFLVTSYSTPCYIYYLVERTVLPVTTANHSIIPETTPKVTLDIGSATSLHSVLPTVTVTYPVTMTTQLSEVQTRVVVTSDAPGSFATSVGASSTSSIASTLVSSRRSIEATLTSSQPDILPSETVTIKVLSTASNSSTRPSFVITTVLPDSVSTSSTSTAVTIPTESSQQQSNTLSIPFITATDSKLLSTYTTNGSLLTSSIRFTPIVAPPSVSEKQNLSITTTTATLSSSVELTTKQQSFQSTHSIASITSASSVQSNGFVSTVVSPGPSQSVSNVTTSSRVSQVLLNGSTTVFQASEGSLLPSTSVASKTLKTSIPSNASSVRMQMGNSSTSQVLNSVTSSTSSSQSQKATMTSAIESLVTTTPVLLQAPSFSVVTSQTASSNISSSLIATASQLQMPSSDNKTSKGSAAMVSSKMSSIDSSSALINASVKATGSSSFSMEMVTSSMSIHTSPNSTSRIGGQLSSVIPTSSRVVSQVAGTSTSISSMPQVAASSSVFLVGSQSSASSTTGKQSAVSSSSANETQLGGLSSSVIATSQGAAATVSLSHSHNNYSVSSLVVVPSTSGIRVTLSTSSSASEQILSVVPSSSGHVPLTDGTSSSLLSHGANTSSAINSTPSPAVSPSSPELAASSSPVPKRRKKRDIRNIGNNSTTATHGVTSVDKLAASVLVTNSVTMTVSPSSLLSPSGVASILPTSSVINQSSSVMQTSVVGGSITLAPSSLLRSSGQPQSVSTSFFSGSVMTNSSQQHGISSQQQGNLTKTAASLSSSGISSSASGETHTVNAQPSVTTIIRSTSSSFNSSSMTMQSHASATAQNLSSVSIFASVTPSGTVSLSSQNVGSSTESSAAVQSTTANTFSSLTQVALLSTSKPVSNATSFTPSMQSSLPSASGSSGEQSSTVGITSSSMSADNRTLPSTSLWNLQTSSAVLHNSTSTPVSTVPSRKSLSADVITSSTVVGSLTLPSASSHDLMTSSVVLGSSNVTHSTTAVSSSKQSSSMDVAFRSTVVVNGIFSSTSSLTVDTSSALLANSSSTSTLFGASSEQASSTGMILSPTATANGTSTSSMVLNSSVPLESATVTLATDVKQHSTMFGNASLTAASSRLSPASSSSFQAIVSSASYSLTRDSSSFTRQVPQSSVVISTTKTENLTSPSVARSSSSANTSAVSVTPQSSIAPTSAELLSSPASDHASETLQQTFSSSRAIQLSLSTSQSRIQQTIVSSSVTSSPSSSFVYRPPLVTISSLGICYVVYTTRLVQPTSTPTPQVNMSSTASVSSTRAINASFTTRVLPSVSLNTSYVVPLPTLTVNISRTQSLVGNATLTPGESSFSSVGLSTVPTINSSISSPSASQTSVASSISVSVLSSTASPLPTTTSVLSKAPPDSTTHVSSSFQHSTSQLSSTSQASSSQVVSPSRTVSQVVSSSVSVPITPAPDQSLLLWTTLVVPQSTDIQSKKFKDELEASLAEAYSFAEVSLRRRRRTTGTTATVQSIDRLNNGDNVTVIFYVTKSGQQVPAVEAAQNYNRLNKNQFARLVNLDVITMPQPLVTPTTSPVPTSYLASLIIQNYPASNISIPANKKKLESNLASYYKDKKQLPESANVTATIQTILHEPNDRAYLEFYITVGGEQVNRTVVVQTFEVPNVNLLTAQLGVQVLVGIYIPDSLSATEYDHVIIGIHVNQNQDLQDTAFRNELANKLGALYVEAKGRKNARRKRRSGSTSATIVDVVRNSNAAVSEADVTFFVFDSGAVANGTHVASVLNRLSTGQMTTYTTPYAVITPPRPALVLSTPTEVVPTVAATPIKWWIIPAVLCPILLIIVIILLVCWRWKKGAPKAKVEPDTIRMLESNRSRAPPVHGFDVARHTEPGVSGMKTTAFMSARDKEEESEKPAGRRRETSLRRKVGKPPIQKLPTREQRLASPAYEEEEEEEEQNESGASVTPTGSTVGLLSSKAAPKLPSATKRTPAPPQRVQEPRRPQEIQRQRELSDDESEEESEVSEEESETEAESEAPPAQMKHSAAQVPTVAVMGEASGPPRYPPVRFRSSVHPGPSLPPLNTKQTSLVGVKVEPPSEDERGRKKGKVTKRELEQRADLERQKNKQRLRDRKRDSARTSLPPERRAWDRAQHDFDDVLVEEENAERVITGKSGKRRRRRPPSTSLARDEEGAPELKSFRKLKSPKTSSTTSRRDRGKKHGKSAGSVSNESSDESEIDMNETRRRMHAMLDDAFALCGPQTAKKLGMEPEGQSPQPEGYPAPSARPVVIPRFVGGHPALPEPPPAHGRATEPTPGQRRRVQPTMPGYPAAMPQTPIGAPGYPGRPPVRPVVTRDPIVVWDPADRQRILNQRAPPPTYAYRDPSGQNVYITPVHQQRDDVGGLVWSPYVAEDTMDALYPDLNQAGHPGALGTSPPKDASFLSQLQAAPPHDTILNMSPSSTLDQRGVPLGQSPQPLIKSIKDELFRLSQGATRKTPITEL